MYAIPRYFKQCLIVIGAAIALPLSAQGEPASEASRERCAGPMMTSPGHMHDGATIDGKFARDESPMNGRPPFGGMFGPGIEPLPPFLRDVALTEIQQDKIFSIMHASAPLAREQGKVAKKTADAIRELAESGSYEETKLKSLADLHARAMTELMILQARSNHQILALLTPEQRKQADAAKAKFEDRHALRAEIEAIKTKFDTPIGASCK